jgi:16S rRNA (cytidine1402-2'-O)-methyltransferase
VKRSGGKSTAKAISGNGARAERDPNRRPRSSKPEPDEFAKSANTGEADDVVAEAVSWHPEHELALGLHLVSTPIGNLGDITVRALWTLRHVDRVLCEDTRVTSRLLARYGIDKPLTPYHDHNAERARPGILEALRQGERLALVSDAGTPLVSDPGFKLVREAVAEGLSVTTAPGPTAAIAALTLSAVPSDVFLFAGFLPSRASARRRALENWRTLDATLVFYEGPSRLADSLADMAEILGDRDAAIARELTKRHEELRRSRLATLAAHYREAGAPRGEIVIVVGPPRPEPASDIDIDALLRDRLTSQSLRDAVAELVRETGLPRQAVYRRALAVRDDTKEP